MGLVALAWRIRARFPSRRLRSAVAALVLIVLLLALMAGAGARRSLLARRFVSEAAGYQYLLVGNAADVRTPTMRAGLVLEGGGTDIDEAFEWMIERSGGGDFVVLLTSGTGTPYNDYIFDMTAPGKPPGRLGRHPDSSQRRFRRLTTRS